MVSKKTRKGPEISGLHLLHVLEHLSDELVLAVQHNTKTYHIAMPIKSFDPRQQLLVVSQ